MIEHGKGHCPLAQAGLTRTINDLHVDLIQKKLKGKGKCHHINSMWWQHSHSSARGRLKSYKGPSFSAQLQVFRFQSQTLSQTSDLPQFHELPLLFLRLRWNHSNVNGVHRFLYCLELTHTHGENKNMYIKKENKRIPSSELDFVLISRVSLMWAKLLYAMHGLRDLGCMPIKLIWWKFKHRIFLLFIFVSTSYNSMTANKH